MPDFVTYKSRETISINLAPTSRLGGGGEGVVYSISGKDTLAAKLFVKFTGNHKESQKEAQLIKEKEPKLLEMLAKPPENQYIAWPQDLLYQKSNHVFAGYLMPKVADAKNLPVLYSPVHRLIKFPSVTHRSLLHIARNVAAVFHAIHGSGYVVGDVNDANTLVRRDGTPFQIDTDSFQVGRHLCRTYVPEFTPPELQLVKLSETRRESHHDCFGLAVLIHKTLLDAAHPFLGVLDGDVEHTFGDRIRYGLYPHKRNSKPGCRPPPQGVLSPTILDRAVQELFRRCFEDGHSAPTGRPTALEWLRCLDEALKRLRPCERNPNHFFSAHLNSCPWCDLARRERVDRFPRSWLLKSECVHGRLEIAPEIATYKHGTKIKLKAIPEEDHYFVGWSGSINSKANPLELIMESNLAITARCEPVPQWKLSVDVQHAQLVRKPDLISYKDGTRVLLTIVPANDYQFVGWEGGSTGTRNPLELTIRENTFLRAKCIPIPYWHLSVRGVNGDVLREPDFHKYKHLTRVKLTAVASKGYRFVAWDGVPQTNQNPVEISMQRDTLLVAKFEVKPFELKLHFSGGRIELAPNRTSFHRGETVTLRAIPSKGYKFTGWHPPLIGNPAELTVLSDTEVHARFEQYPPNLWASESLVFSFISLLVSGLRFMPKEWWQFLSSGSHHWLDPAVWIIAALTFLLSVIGFVIAVKRDGEGRPQSIWAILLAILASSLPFLFRM